MINILLSSNNYRPKAEDERLGIVIKKINHGIRIFFYFLVKKKKNKKNIVSRFFWFLFFIICLKKWVNKTELCMRLVFYVYN